MPKKIVLDNKTRESLVSYRANHSITDTMSKFNLGYSVVSRYAPSTKEERSLRISEGIKASRQKKTMLISKPDYKQQLIALGERINALTNEYISMLKMVV